MDAGGDRRRRRQPAALPGHQHLLPPLAHPGAAAPRRGDPGGRGLGLDFSPAYRATNLAALSGWRGNALLQAGIVDARNVRLETVDELQGLLGEIGQHVPAERTLTSPSTALLYLPRRIAMAKLDR